MPKFERDPDKAANNAKRHRGVTFEDAIPVFDDDRALTGHLIHMRTAQDHRQGRGPVSRRCLQNAKTAFASSRPERPRHKNGKRTMIRVERRGGKYVQVMPDGSTRRLKSKTDWTAFDALTDAEVHKAALSDPDAQPLTRTQLAKMRRISRVEHLRWKLGLSQAQFGERFNPRRYTP